MAKGNPLTRVHQDFLDHLDKIRKKTDKSSAEITREIAQKLKF